MRPTLRVAIMLARVLGVLQIVIGLAIWFGAARGAVAFHSAAGSLFVLVLWIIAAIALFALPRRMLALLAMLWGGLVLWLGMAQITMLPGSGHWIVRVAHLVVGLAALGLAEALAGATRRHWASTHGT